MHFEERQNRGHAGFATAPAAPFGASTTSASTGVHGRPQGRCTRSEPPGFVSTAIHVDRSGDQPASSRQHSSYGQLGPSVQHHTAASPLGASPASVTSTAAATAMLLQQSQPLNTSSESPSSRKRWPVRRHGSLDGERELGPVRGLEKSSAKRSRRQKLGMFPSMTDLVAFGGAATQGDIDLGANSSAGCSGMRKTKSLHARLNYHLADNTAARGADPWQQFAQWRARNPGASRSEARAFIERKLAQPKE